MGWEIFGPPAPKRPLLPTLGAPKSPESGYGPWEATASPLVQRRRKPDGSYETRATPGAVPGGKPALGKVEKPDTSAKAIAKEGLKLFGTSVLDNVTSAPEQLEAALEAPRTLIRKVVRKEPIATQATVAELLRGPEKSVLRDAPYRKTVRDLHQKGTERFAEATQDLPTPVSTGLDAAVELGAGLVDPTNLPATGPLKPASATREAVDLLDGISFKALDDADLRAALQKGVQPVSPGYGGSAEAIRFAAWLDKHGLDYDAAQRFGELPWLREKFFNLDNPDATPPPSFYGAKPGESGHITFGRDPDPDLGRAMEAPELPSAPSGPVRDPQMSTKALENVAGMQDEFAELVADNYDVVAKGRGPVRPVSVYHDANALADELGMTREDFLEIAPRIGDKEVSLGKAFMAGAKQEINDLARQLADGSAADPVAAKDRLDQLSVDVVRMMANIQGRFSEGGRILRSGQEALGPFNLATTPKEKLQLGLLKRYGVANKEAAEALEAKAVAQLQRRAAAEARRTQRAATAQDLSAEFTSLAAEFGKLSRGSGAAAIVPPDMVNLMGRMAQNRVKAGVNSVAQIADEIFLVARDHIDGLTVEDVRAAIVDTALAKKPRTRPLLDPEARRLRVAEGAAGRNARDLEAQVAAGGAPKPKPPPLSSPKLDALRQRQAELREQIDALRAAGHQPKDPLLVRSERVQKGLERQIRDLEVRLKSGPRLPEKKAPVSSPQIDALRTRASDLRAQIMKDPREQLVQRYREALDEETIRMIAQLPDDPRSPDMLNFLRKMERPTFKDYRMSYWINSVLSGTKTTLRNLNGNVVRLAEQTAMRPAGAVVEGILAPLQGRAPERLMRETLPATMGVFRGVPEGLKRFAFVMKNGYDPERLVAELTEGAEKKFDGRLPVDPFLLSHSPAVRGVGAVVTLPTRLLSATDALFKTMASTSENYAWATRKAIQEGADDVPGRVAELVLEQPEEMVQAARAFAEKATFQDPMSWVGSAAASLRRGPPGTDKLVNALEDRGGVGRALVPLLRAPQTVMEHLLPFIHVSDRVAASVTDYIPGSKPRKLAYLLATKDPEAADLIARQVVGAGLGMLGLKWAAEGRLVGAAPKDEALRNDFYSEGKQPYSLLIGGRWVPIRDTLGPLAGPFVAAALYQDHVQAHEDPVPATVGMTLSSARYMLDASYMSTLQDVIEAIETDNSGEVGRGMTQAAARVVGGYNPYSGLQRNAATALDPRVVERESFTDELKSGVPGLRSELPARIGPRGEELTQTTGALGGVSPVVPTRNRVADPELAERVERLRYTLQGMRRQYGRTEKAIDNAERGAAGEAGLAGKDEQLRARVQQLRGQLPPVGDPTAAIDATMDDVRDLENAIRDIRADPNLDDATKREREVYWQQRLELLLQQTIEQLQQAQ